MVASCWSSFTIILWCTDTWTSCLFKLKIYRRMYFPIQIHFLYRLIIHFTQVLVGYDLLLKNMARGLLMHIYIWETCS